MRSAIVKVKNDQFSAHLPKQQIAFSAQQYRRNQSLMQRVFGTSYIY